MEIINNDDRNKLIQFINENDLDYTQIDNGITKPHLVSYDGYKLFFYIYENKYVLVKYDKDKDKPGKQAYEYFYFDTMPKMLEQLKHYDQSIHKIWWYTVTNSIDYPFDKANYKEDWFEEFTKDNFYSLDENIHCKYITYTNNNYKPVIKSPYETLSEDAWASMIHKSEPKNIDKLYFEIHPISTLEGAEKYEFKLLMNDDDLFKEYINYRVISKKGLRLLIENLFKELETFIIK